MNRLKGDYEYRQGEIVGDPVRIKSGLVAI